MSTTKLTLLAVLLAPLAGCPAQPEFSCDPFSSSDRVVVQGTLWSGDPLTEAEAFMGFGRFSSFEVRADCEVTAYAQSTEVGPWARTHVGSATFAQLETALEPLLSRIRWRPSSSANAGISGAGSLSVTMDDERWHFHCGQCADRDLEASFITATNALYGFGSPMNTSLVDIFGSPVDTDVASVPWPFAGADPSQLDDGPVTLDSLDSVVALALWEQYEVDRVASWPSHPQAIYVESGSDAYALYMREQIVP